jgi:hypothetical protein
MLALLSTSQSAPLPLMGLRQPLAIPAKPNRQVPLSSAKVLASNALDFSNQLEPVIISTPRIKFVGALTSAKIFFLNFSQG